MTPDATELAAAIEKVRRARAGDSNDGEISALNYALELALRVGPQKRLLARLYDYNSEDD
jgi:hypothetical protein